MTMPEVDAAQWESLDLEWHGDFAFMDGALLGDDSAREAYIMLALAGKLPSEIAQEASSWRFPSSPLRARQMVWRHRTHPGLLRDSQRDYYLLPHYLARYGYHAVQALPFRFNGTLEDLGYHYWRDQSCAYWFGDYSVTVMVDVKHQALALLGPAPAFVSADCALFSDGVNVFLSGKVTASAHDRIRYTNHPDYRVIYGQVYRGYKRLHQKDGTPLPIAHPDGFRMLAQRWGTDGESIIVQAQQGSSIAYEYFYRIDHADLATFTVLNERYAKDGQRAYYLTGKSMRYVGDFQLLKCRQPEFDEAGRVVSAREFQHEYIAVDDQFVYAAGTRVRGAHGPSFQHLGFDYYRDHQRAYYRNKPLHVDVDSFVVALVHHAGADYSSRLVGDRNGPLGSDGVLDKVMQQRWAPFFEAHPQLTDYWWHRLQAQDEAQAAQQEEIPARRVIGSGFELGRHVYFHGRPITGLDAASFKLLGEHLCGDVNGLYLIPYHEVDRAVPERFSTESVEHFSAFDSIYLSDGKKVYCHRIFYHCPEPISKADLATFVSCGYGWAKDSRAVYYRGQAKKSLVPENTRILGIYAFNSTLMMSDGKPLAVEFSPEEVSVPHPHFLQLGTRKLFCGRSPLSAKRIDLATLAFLDDRHARDKHRFYRYDGHAGLTEVSEEDYREGLAKQSVS
ncbi:DKNYY domain-containing protein [Janthinobacterium sp. NFX145]|uniref:DKNYY domain-containing protein n=1 Tax=Janthinobacterium sp. NFX145 TaxID=3415602 RepID=UPI003CC5425C